jgi:hypothetical protein
MVSQSLFGWAEPEILVQSHKCSGFPTAENDASCVSVDDRRSVKVVGTVLDCWYPSRRLPSQAELSQTGSQKPVSLFKISFLII